MGSSSYRDLIVWQKAIDLSVAVYKLTDSFPKNEQFGLVSQMCRSAVSISANIAEGSKRGTRKDFASFLRIANGSGAELESLLLIAKRLTWSTELDFQPSEKLLDDVMRLLNRLIVVIATAKNKKR